MSAETILYLILGASAGGFINGLAGTGTALFTLGFFLQVLSPVTSVAIIALMAVFTGLQGLWVVRSAIKAQTVPVAQYTIPGLVGVPLGILLLQAIDAYSLRIGIAALLITFGAYFSFRSRLPAFNRRTPWVDGTIGFVGGVLGGAASLSGAIPTMWLSLRPWPKQKIRAILQPYNMVILVTTVALLFFRGAYDSTVIQALVVVIPVSLVAARVGIYVYKNISDSSFRRLLITLTLVMGVGILIQTLK